MSVAGELVEVRLMQVPLRLRERSRQHGADLLREMTLLQAGLVRHDGDGDVPSGAQVPDRLRRLAHELDVVYGPYVAASSEQMDRAVDDGQASLDVSFHLPADTVPFMHRVSDLLAEVEQYCRDDSYLLILAPPRDIAAYRTWSIGQVLDQFAGQPPTPWPVWAREHDVPWSDPRRQVEESP